MKPTQFHPAFSGLALILALAPTATATAAQLSLRFAGGGNEITLAYGETATLELVWRMDATDTSKSGTRITGLSTRFNVVDGEGTDIAGLWMESVTGLAGWELFNSNGVPFTEGDFYLDLYDPAGTGVAGDGTEFETTLATFQVRNDAMEAEDEAFVTFRHAGPADPLPSAENGAAYWSFPWQSEVVMAGQFDLGQGNCGDADPVWDPYHGYETLQPLTIHRTGGTYSQTASCAEKLWTSTGDFADGSASNRIKGVNIDYTSTSNQISVNIAGDQLKPLPYLWAACSSRGTIVRVNTNSGEVLGEYWTAPGQRQKNPSRTTVDLFGNVWAGSRVEADDSLGSVVKVGHVIGGRRQKQNGEEDPEGEFIAPPFDFCSCADRDNDGRIRTSAGLTNVLPWPDNGDGRGGEACEPALVENAVDECILIYQRVNPDQVRHVSVDANNNVWVGADGRRVPPTPDVGHPLFDLLDGETGAFLASFEARDGSAISGGYGGFIDGQGVLWSSSPGDFNDLLRYDTATGLIQILDYSGIPLAANTYGLAIDTAGSVWVSQWLDPAAGGRITKLDPDGTMATGFPKTYGNIAQGTGGNWDRGVVVRPHDNSVWIAHSGAPNGPGTFSKVARLDSTGTLTATIDLNTAAAGEVNNGQGPTGLTVDANGQVWVTCFTSSTLKRINPVNNTVTRTIDLNSNGTGTPDPIHPAQPYNYSDMTGIQAAMALRWGMWTAVHDSTQVGARWSRVTWNTGSCVADPEPGVSSIRVQVRAADGDTPAEAETALTRQAFIEVENGQPLPKALVGQFVQVRAILRADSTPGSTDRPVLCDLAIFGDSLSGRNCNGNGLPDSCEFDDCNLNCTDDATEIASGASRDLNNDGVPDECAPPVITHVDADATGNPDGKTWGTAFLNLQDALHATPCGQPAVIWVAEGTYKPGGPASGGSDVAARSKTFQLTRGVALYGGFAGDETELDQRDPKTHLTILSGDLNGDDLPSDPFNPFFVDENSYNVVTATGSDATSLIDGFTIQGGNANLWGNQPPINHEGGGMYMESGSPTIRNCVFLHNQARVSGEGLGSGGGLFAKDNSSPTLINCRFFGNLANDRGGGVLLDTGGNASLVNCLFTGNEASLGAGIDIRHAEARLTNCTFGDNAAGASGGAVEVSYQPGSIQPQSSIGTLRNCILWGNTVAPGGSGPQIANAGNDDQPQTSIVVDYNDISGGTADIDLSGGGTLTWGADNLDPPADPAFESGTFRLSAVSPCLNVGDNASVPAGITTDIVGNPRRADGIVDLGAYEREGVPSATLISAFSVGGNCWLELLPERKSEPRQAGITSLFLVFDVALQPGAYAVSDGGSGSAGVTVEQATCAAPAFMPYSGSLAGATAFASSSTMTINVPTLVNGRTYRFNLGPNITAVPNQNIEVRGLIGDVNSSGRVNATDRSVVVGVWTGPGSYSCLTDLNDDGTTNATDRSIVIGAWTSPQNCAPKAVATSTVGGWRGGNPPTRPAVKLPIRIPQGSGEPGGRITPILDEPAPPLASKTGGSESDAEWTTVFGTAELTVRPMGGGGPVSELEVGQRYEVRYAGASHPVEAYALFVSTHECDTPPMTAPITAVVPADATGLFGFSAIEGDPATQNAEGLVRCVMAVDDQSDTGWLGGPQGPVCTFTAAQPGEMVLELWLSWVDEPGRTTYESSALVNLMSGE